MMFVLKHNDNQRFYDNTWIEIELGNTQRRAYFYTINLVVINSIKKKPLCQGKKYSIVFGHIEK